MERKMASILPESGKPIDLDQSLITSAQEARIVLSWLDDLIIDMQHQVLQHLTGSQLDMEWLSKVRSALRATIRTRFQVAEKKADFERQQSRDQMFASVAVEILDKGDVENVWGEVDRRLRDQTV